ncbi:beta-galactosidase [Paenibacillus sp. BAC0078]
MIKSNGRTGLEPSEGDFQFGWLDKAIDLFHKYGLQVVIGTPTAFF